MGNTSYDRFHERNQKLIEGREIANRRFVIAGYNSTTITDDITGDTHTAAVVSKQEQDLAYIYTFTNEPLNIGSVWSVKKGALHYLISEEIIVIKDTKWRKYRAILCNVNIGDVWGLFKGPEEGFVNINLQQTVLLQSQQHPILVLPANSLHIGDKVAIKNRGWLVQEEDSISTEGISYYSLIASAISKEVTEDFLDEDAYIEQGGTIVPDLPIKPSDHDLIKYVYANEEVAVKTEGGYFKSSSSEITVVRRNSTQAVFRMPYGLASTQITIKQNGELITYIYKLVTDKEA